MCHPHPGQQVAAQPEAISIKQVPPQSMPAHFPQRALSRRACHPAPRAEQQQPQAIPTGNNATERAAPRPGQATSAKVIVPAQATNSASNAH